MQPPHAPVEARTQNDSTCGGFCGQHVEPPPQLEARVCLTFSARLQCLLAYVRNTPFFHYRKMALPDTNDPHFFCFDIAAAERRMQRLCRTCIKLRQMLRTQAARSAESNGGVAEHAVGDASFVGFFSCLWGRHIATLFCTPDLNSISGALAFIWVPACIGEWGSFKNHLRFECTLFLSTTFMTSLALARASG